MNECSFIFKFIYIHCMKKERKKKMIIFLIRLSECVIHDHRLQRRAINRPAGSSSPLKQAMFGLAGFSRLRLLALKFISGRPTVVNYILSQIKKYFCSYFFLDL